MLRAWRDTRRTALPSAHAPPLSRDLRDFPVAFKPELPPSVGAPPQARRRFPECHPHAVRWPERFRGGCAFGAGASPVSSARGLDLTDATLTSAPERVNAAPAILTC